jgi:hypothetical protein
LPQRNIPAAGPVGSSTGRGGAINTTVTVWSPDGATAITLATMLRMVLKVFHQLGAIGVMGALACCIVLVVVAPKDSLVEYAALRQGIATITRWLLVPSLLLVLVTGLLAIAANRAYMDAGWAWIKAALGLVMFEGTLLTIQSSATRAGEIAALAAGSGHADPVALEPLLRTEWAGLWTMLALSFANIVLAVWRPKLRRNRADALQ